MLKAQARRERQAQKAKEAEATEAERKEQARQAEQAASDELRQRARNLLARLRISVADFATIAGYGLQGHLDGEDIIGRHLRGIIAEALDDLERTGSLEALHAMHEHAADQEEFEELQSYWENTRDGAQKMFVSWLVDQGFVRKHYADGSPKELADETPASSDTQGNGAIVCAADGCDQVRPPMRGRPPRRWFCEEHAR
jgi:hypothetical protein